MKRSPLKRKTWMRKVRKEPRPGRLKGEDMTELRQFVYDRDKGLCAGCGKWVSFTDCHLAHIRNKRMWGDNPENAHIKHFYCHIVLEHNPKACPPADWRK